MEVDTVALQSRLGYTNPFLYVHETQSNRLCSVRIRRVEDMRGRTSNNVEVCLDGRLRCIAMYRLTSTQ